MKKLWIIVSVLLLCACGAKSKPEQKEEKKKEEKPDIVAEVSFSAVGDNLIHGALFTYNNDFTYMYEATNYLTQDADISYLNQETICGGRELGLSHYPSFNGPYEVLDGAASAGFNWLATSSNHSLDAGEQGILNQLQYLKTNYPDIATTGTHASLEEAQQNTVIEKNGVRVGILGYTYGLNGYVLPEGKEYLVDLIDKEKIVADVKRLEKDSDIIAVSMHWGEEYSFTPSEEQQELAQFLSDLGVDVIIGEHPHVIQPMDFLTGRQGNQTLVIYSLGNFLSAQDQSDRMLGGMARFKVVYNKTKDEVSFKDVEFWPTITYITDGYQRYGTYALKDYTNELAATHTLMAEGQNVTREYFIERVNSIMNDKVKIVY